MGASWQAMLPGKQTFIIQSTIQALPLSNVLGWRECKDGQDVFLAVEESYSVSFHTCQEGATAPQSQADTCPMPHCAGAGKNADNYKALLTNMPQGSTAPSPWQVLQCLCPHSYLICLEWLWSMRPKYVPESSIALPSRVLSMSPDSVPSSPRACAPIRGFR